MSYDIHLVLAKVGESLRDAAYQDQVDGPPCSSESRARNDRVVMALTQRFPELEKFESDHHVELTDLGSTTGVQISLHADSGAIAIPYWHTENAVAVLQRVDDILSTVLQNSDFRAFDPQTEQEVVPGSLRESALAYSVGAAALQEIARKVPKTAWWQFWK